MKVYTLSFYTRHGKHYLDLGEVFASFEEAISFARSTLHLGDYFFIKSSDSEDQCDDCFPHCQINP
jgi:hypothetical protein